MTGGAAATLIGLMFIALSLGTHLVNDEATANIQAFVNPTLLDFSSALGMAFIMLVPGHTVASLVICLLVVGVGGFQRSVGVWLQMRRMRDQQTINPAHWYWHGYFPMLNYGLICLAAVWFAQAEADLALDVIALDTAAILFIGIKNTWVLTLWIARNSRR